MNNIHNWLNSAAIALICLVVLFGGQSAAPSAETPKAGNTTASFWDAALGFKMNGTTVLNATTIKTTTAGGTLTVATSNTATSTSALGCVQTTATSTATPIKLFIGSGNTSASTTASSATIGGFVVWAFGTCP